MRERWEGCWLWRDLSAFALAANSGGSLLLLLMVSAALLRPLSSSSFSSTSPIPDINCVCSYCLLRPADEGKDVERIRSVPETGKEKNDGKAPRLLERNRNDPLEISHEEATKTGYKELKA